MVVFLENGSNCYYNVDKSTLDKMVDLVLEKKPISEISHSMMNHSDNFDNSILELDVILQSS